MRKDLCDGKLYVCKMRQFDYPCPDCRSTSNLHDRECSYSNSERAELEQAYFDILVPLSASSQTKDELKENCRSAWRPLYEDCLIRLRHEYILTEEERGNSDVKEYRILNAEERKDAVSEPQYEPMKTIYEKGSVPGAHDNAVFAMIAFYEMVGLSWGETKEKMVKWLDESGSWERGGFAEKTPEELVEKKKHVYDEGYGWRDKAEAAKRVIDRKLGE